MESLDAEFSGKPRPLINPADAKAEEAKRADRAPLNPIEFFVAESTRVNFGLFDNALKQAIEQTQSCFNDQWIPEGDAADLMQRMDFARNFLALAETYFTALATPLMQAANLHIQHQQATAAMAPIEPSAAERALQGFDLVGRWVIILAGPRQGSKGLIRQYDSEDFDYGIEFQDHSGVHWYFRSGFTVIED